MRAYTRLNALMAAAVLGCLCAAMGSAFAEPLPPLPEGAFTLAVIPDTQRYEGEGKQVKPGMPARHADTCHSPLPFPAGTREDRGLERQALNGRAAHVLSWVDGP